MMHKHGHMDAVQAWRVVMLQWGVNSAGALLLIAEYRWLLPLEPAASDPAIVRNNIILGLCFLAASWLYLGVVAAPRTKRALRWTCEGRDPTDEERDLTLGLPMEWFRHGVVTWGIPSLVLLALNLRHDVSASLLMFGEILAVGAAVAATAYLLTQRLLRDATHHVLDIAPPEPGSTPGVGSRTVFIWTLSTGMPLLAFVLMVAFAPETQPTFTRLAWIAALVGGPIFVVGGVAIALLAKSIGQPLNEVTRAMERIENGELDLHVDVNDYGEIGQLQAGMNRMATALREREQLRDLFGKHVGEDVARQALEHGVKLGGEEIEAAALFVDVIGSTTIAMERSPAEVVTSLNRFFEVVVQVVAQHGGLVNKFEGDAALCIFGAPLQLDDPASAALAAAREMAERLRAEVTDLEAGIGVSQGLVIAGNIGATDRLEYTVIGDPVNEAARLTEQAKDRPERVVASQRIVDRSNALERARWTMLEPKVLRGRLEPTILAVPA